MTEGNSCYFPLTQSTIADSLGLSTVHVNRSMMRLREQGFFTPESKTLTMLKWGELKEYAEFDPIYLHVDNPEAA